MTTYASKSAFYTRDGATYVALNPTNDSGMVSDKDATANSVNNSIINCYNEWYNKCYMNNRLVYNLYTCHLNCHGNCHSVRSRR